LTEGIATAFGGVLTSRLIYDMFGPGQPMNPTKIDCAGDDLTACDLGLFESIDWLTTRDKGEIVRPGPDWQPQKDCPPGDLGCGCLVGTCGDGLTCQGGYCVDPSGSCTPDTQGCSVDQGCPGDDGLAELGGFCVLPVTYSDGWTWRVLWDLLDEDEEVQPEISHWRTSQMNDDADPDVGPLYDTFGDVEQFWRFMIATLGNSSADPVAQDDFHPNLPDFLDRFRCTLEDEAAAALDHYLVNVVEFPYHNPEAPCP
jgi:hypothetical protein